jgi:hypothetical protein
LRGKAAFAEISGTMMAVKIPKTAGMLSGIVGKIIIDKQCCFLYTGLVQKLE